MGFCVLWKVTKQEPPADRDAMPVVSEDDTPERGPDDISPSASRRIASCVADSRSALAVVGTPEFSKRYTAAWENTIDAIKFGSFNVNLQADPAKQNMATWGTQTYRLQQALFSMQQLDGDITAGQVDNEGANRRAKEISRALDTLATK